MEKLFSLFLRVVDHMNEPRFAYAHCDIPCGIYTANPAQVAAKTVETMVQKLQAVEPCSQTPTKEEGLAYHNTVTRMIHVKEEHAALCKKELLILWTDYFKEEHLAMFSDLHTTFWKAAKLCSKNKQEVNLQAAADLRKAVDEVAAMFEKAEAKKKAS